MQKLFDSIDPGIKSQNEPERLTKVGAPDFSFHRGSVVMGHAEAKIPGSDLKGLKGREKDQLDRYRHALPNLIYTDCLLFLFYRDGQLLHEVRIAEDMFGLRSVPDQFDALEHALNDFAVQTPRTITSPEVLAKLMAGKAALVKDILGNSLVQDKDDKTELSGQYHAFRQHMIHDISIDDFAGMYAETIAYGMFAARLHDKSLDTFDRHEALDLLPKSNPFLRNLFGYIAGPNLDERIRWIIDDLAKVFQACDVAGIMQGFGKLTGRNDPFLHFYETFLAAYDPKKRKARGVWYTPEPVVNFIVRAVDEVLQKEFRLPLGLADTSKVKVDWDTGQTDSKGKRVSIKKEVHRVQILDPATGTGTFLAEVIKQIAPRIQGIAPGQWSGYVEQELIPRLHGFELLMASYAMCHMKLDMMLAEMGYKPTKTPPRLSVYLTNSLEEGEPANQSLPFAQWLSNEVKEANTIKRDMPIMCVIGNPPYLGEGGKSEGWIGRLMDAYKKEPGGVERLKERNPKWLNDLYVKFIRMSENLIEKNGEGVLGFITNHGYLDNPTFRGMRWHLLKTFDKVYVLDLHGNAKKKEVTPEGAPDKNVFDIQQGVAIIVGVKRAGKSDALAEVLQGDVWGTRTAKYDALEAGGLGSGMFARLDTPAPQYPMVRRNYALEEEYKKGFSLSDLFPTSSMGVMTKRDTVAIQWDRHELQKLLNDLDTLPIDVIRNSYSEVHDARDWNLAGVKRNLRKFGTDHIRPVMYRPFDYRQTYYTDFSRGFLAYPVYEVGRHMLQPNLCLTTIRKADVVQDWSHAFCIDGIMVHHGISMKEGNYIFPLYLYPEEQDLDRERRPNFAPSIHSRLTAAVSQAGGSKPTPEDIFDYIYAVLHCPSYRETYAEFLRADFPRIPWPKSPDQFWALVPQGAALRQLHLMDTTAIGDTPYIFEGEGNNVVDMPRCEDRKIWINKTQGFAGVPLVAWEFFIGGYQPAQKWLKDRKGRALSFADIQHYQRIIKVLSETHRIMQGITMDLG